jgi:hypothetical protein
MGEEQSAPFSLHLRSSFCWTTLRFLFIEWLKAKWAKIPMTWIQCLTWMLVLKFVTIWHHSFSLTLWQGGIILIEPYPPRVLWNTKADILFGDIQARKLAVGDVRRNFKDWSGAAKRKSKEKLDIVHYSPVVSVKIHQFVLVFAPFHTVTTYHGSSLDFSLLSMWSEHRAEAINGTCCGCSTFYFKIINFIILFFMHNQN